MPQYRLVIEVRSRVHKMNSVHDLVTQSIRLDGGVVVIGEAGFGGDFGLPSSGGFSGSTLIEMI